MAMSYCHPWPIRRPSNYNRNDILVSLTHPDFSTVEKDRAGVMRHVCTSAWKVRVDEQVYEYQMEGRKLLVVTFRIEHCFAKKKKKAIRITFIFKATNVCVSRELPEKMESSNL